MTKRKYNSSRRQEQARQTRRQIVEAARNLFAERGYTGQPFQGVATGPHEDGVVRMAGRFANRLSGVWSADCELQR
jgi:hypothetical protein